MKSTESAGSRFQVGDHAGNGDRRARRQKYVLIENLPVFIANRTIELGTARFHSSNKTASTSGIASFHLVFLGILTKISAILQALITTPFSYCETTAPSPSKKVYDS